VVGGAGGNKARRDSGERMPGVTMEYANGNGAHMNHDRDTRPNGINGSSHASESVEKGKGRSEVGGMLPLHPSPANGVNGTSIDRAPQERVSGVESVPQNMLDQLPPELIHITEGYLPLARLLERLAQTSHNELEAKILELADMPLPQSMLNGNGAHAPVEDHSADNISRKLRLLKLAQELHAKWVKALVLTQWSRKSEDVSKLIDLTMYLRTRKWQYDGALGEMSELKRSLAPAALPNPDLKTALEVLSTGKASWMPDVCFGSREFVTLANCYSLDTLSRNP
jgi:mediator of RNA polymerase II transcription subunit 14